MARYWRDFSEYSGGEKVSDGVPSWGSPYTYSSTSALAAGFTGDWSTSSGVVDASGTKLFQFARSATGSFFNAIFDTTTDSITGDAEICLKFRHTGARPTSGAHGFALLRGRTTDANAASNFAYFCELYDDDNGAGESRWRMCAYLGANDGISNGYTSGVSAIYATSGLGTVDQDEDWYLRFQVRSNVFKAKAWPASGSEPAWQVTGTTNSLPTGDAWEAGYAGFGSYNTGTTFAVVGMGVASGTDIKDVGDGAPTAAIGASAAVPSSIIRPRQGIAFGSANRRF